MDASDFFEHIRKQFNDELPFVAYRKPNETQLKSLLQKDASLHETDDFTESGFVFAPFDNSKKTILIPIIGSNLITSEFFTLQNDKTSQNNIKNNEESKLHHLALVQKAIDEIKQGELEKVVVSRKEELSISNQDPIAIFSRLLMTYATAFVYCWYHPKIGVWLGATPETLVKIEGNTLSTMALAGTQIFIDSEDVIWQDKEKNEQQFVTDFIVSSLQPSVIHLQLSAAETIRAGNLLHLKTDIKARFDPETLNLKQILNNLHPTPAICGLPKTKAKQFILANELYERDYYSGFLGELNFKNKTSRNSNRRNVENNAYSSIKTTSNLYVNLRCMQLQKGKAIIYIGGGITKDSNPEREWEETVSKSEVIKSIL